MGIVSEPNKSKVEISLTMLRSYLRAVIVKRGDLSKIAQEHNVNKFYISKIVNDDDYLPPNKVLDRFGFDIPRYVFPKSCTIAPGTKVSFDSKICPVCNDPFLPRVPNQVCCSPECRSKRKHEQRNK